MIIVDAINCTHYLCPDKAKKDALEQLAATLTKTFSGKEIIIVVDGFYLSLEKPDSKLRFRFSDNRSADDLVVDILKKQKRSCTVVTNDRELARRCSALGASVLGSTHLKKRKSKHTAVRNTKRDFKPSHGDSPIFDTLLKLRFEDENRPD